MVGMSRDKCGAAAVLGFLQVVNLLQPKNVRVVAGVGIVRFVICWQSCGSQTQQCFVFRNSIGSNSYVADEVITARSGARVRIINTDAEGRMIMADILCRVSLRDDKFLNPFYMQMVPATFFLLRNQQRFWPNIIYMFYIIIRS